MVSNVPNRKDIRNMLATLMEADLVGVSKAAKKFYGYKPASFDEESTHIIVLTSASADRSKQAQPVRAHSVLNFDVWLFVVYAAKDWTEQQSEDKLDDMEKEVSDWLLDHADNNDNWQGIMLGKTEYDVVPSVGGTAYRQEVIPIEVEIYSE